MLYRRAVLQNLWFCTPKNYERRTYVGTVPWLEPLEMLEIFIKIRLVSAMNLAGVCFRPIHEVKQLVHKLRLYLDRCQPIVFF